MAIAKIESHEIVVLLKLSRQEVDFIRGLTQHYYAARYAVKGSIALDKEKEEHKELREGIYTALSDLR